VSLRVLSTCSLISRSSSRRNSSTLRTDITKPLRANSGTILSCDGCGSRVHPVENVHLLLMRKVQCVAVVYGIKGDSDLRRAAFVVVRSGLEDLFETADYGTTLRRGKINTSSRCAKWRSGEQFGNCNPADAAIVLRSRWASASCRGHGA